MEDSLGNKCGPGETLYTFAVEYADQGTFEEIDVYARDMFNARMKAEICANSELQAGWTSIRSMEAGGSSGIVYQSR